VVFIPALNGFKTMLEATGLVTFCVETAFYNRKDKRGDKSDRKTRKKT
jgi:hypothetical protein